jgi:hypothetical protein
VLYFSYGEFSRKKSGKIEEVANFYQNMEELNVKIAQNYNGTDERLFCKHRFTR